MMRKHERSGPPLVSAVMLLLLMTLGASSQGIGLVTLDTKEVAKGYRAGALQLKPVVNEKGETIGLIDDFIFGRDDCNIFAVLAVGDFIGSAGQLVAVPFRSLKLDDPSGSIVLPGASRAALQKLPVFLYNR
jgi:PRC-barrel domain